MSYAAQWLAYTFPYRRFAHILADVHARLGADAVCYSFITAGFHRFTPCRFVPAHPHVHRDCLDAGKLLSGRPAQ